MKKNFTKKVLDLSSDIKRIAQLSFVIIILVAFLQHGSYGQAQTIGSFPSMEGSFENTTTAQQAATTVATGVQLTSWTGANVANSTPSISTTTVRTGGKSLQWVTGSTSGVLFSNTATSTAVANATAYVVQFYWWKGYSGSARAFGTQIGPNGTTNLGSSVGSGTLGTSAVSSAWTKATVLVTSGTDNTGTRYGLVRLAPNGGSFATPGYSIDDFVVYPGAAADVTAPAAASGASATPTSGTTVNVSWTGLVNAGDGGGYVIVRSTSPTAVTLNANGIYGVGNTSVTGGGTIVGIVPGVAGTNTFSSTGLTSGTTYYYSIFAVDKAFNYAAAATANATPQACAAPSISGHPSTTPQLLCLNDVATGFSVLATGTGTLSYQWQSSTASNFSANVLNVGTNLGNYTPLTNAVGTLYYRCVVTNDCGGGSTNTANSNISGAVTIQPAPAITVQPTTTPANYPQNFGSPSAISVTATGAGLTYQWYSSTDNVTNTAGDDIALGTSSSETPSTASLGTLYYYCVVSGTCPPSVTSNVSGAVNILPACTAPTFSVGPTNNQSECVGGTLTLGTVVADQSPTYQWFSNTSLSNTGGTSVGAGSGGSTDTYTPPSATPGIYFYYVVATSGACSTPSIPVQITVNATAIASQSTPAATYSLNASASALTVTAAAYSAGLSYQWYSSTDAVTNTGGDDIAVGTNNNSYTPLTTSLGTLYYYVVVSGNCTPSSATSAISGAITVVQYITGDYVSTNNGSWETVGTWSTWNGTTLVAAGVIPNNSAVNVYINGGFNVTYPTTDRACNNLYVLNGSLKTGTTITGGNRRYIFVHGTTVEVGPNGTLGSALTGDNADAICIDLRNTGIVTFSGSGGLANFGLIRYNNTDEVIIDRDITLNYHGSAFAGNAMAYFSNITATDDNTLTINAGKTLTFAPWACYSATGSSGVLAAVNLNIVVNGTLTMQAYPTYYTGARGYMSTGVGAGKIFYLYIESTGTVNLREFWPNGTGGNGDPGFVEIVSGGVLNVANVTDLRNTGNAIYGAGAFNVQNGATLRLRDPLGITAAPAATGAIQTGVRTFSTGASYTYEALLGAQVTGDGLPATVRNFTINNINGVTLTNNVAVDSVLALTNGKLATGAGKVTVNATGSSITGASAANYVNGNLERAVAAGASTVAFPVGDAASYTPLSLAFGAGNTSGNVTASATIPGAPPAAGFAPTGSGINQAKYINRSWALTSTISSPQYAATFTYINPGDVVGGANTSALIVAKNDGGTWSNPGVASSVAPSVATVSGLTSFSTFHLGEDGCEPVGITSATAFPVGPLCSGQTTDLTANGVVGTNAVVTWYTGPNGTGANLGTGLTLNGVGANTYYARVTGTCGTPQEQSVNVASIPNTFTGTGDWTDNARWSCGAPPSSGDAVVIAAGANATLNTNFLVSGSLTMAATSTLIVNPTRTLSIDVAATANFAGQSVTFKSDATGTASLGQVNGTLSGASNVTVERYIPNNSFRSWRLLSIPVTSSQTIRQAWQEGDANPNPKDNNIANYGTQITGAYPSQALAAANGFDSTSTNWAMLRWNGTNWSNITNTNAAINNFNSYFLYIRGERSLSVTGLINSSSATTLRTKGTVFTGDQTTNVGAGAFALVPNLYPSAINFTGLIRTGGVNNLFYIWDSKKQSGGSLGVYQTFSSTNSFNCLIAGGSYTFGSPNTTIESGQSFFVTSGAAGTIVLKEAAKISGTNGSLGFRPAAKSKIDTRLLNSTGDVLDANTVVFDASYDKAVAGEDAPKFGNPGANFAIENSHKLLAIEGTEPAKDGDAIQFRMWNIAKGNYKLELATSNLSLEEGMEAMLEDSYLKTKTAVSLSANTTVSFAVDANAGSSAANRFRVVFAKANPAIVNSKQTFTIAPNPITTGVMNVVFSNQAAGRYSIRMVASGGQSVMAKTIAHAGGTATQNIQLPSGLANGAYTVEIVAEGKTRSVQTVIVNKQ